jgi:hypothetical protein
MKSGGKTNMHKKGATPMAILFLTIAFVLLIGLTWKTFLIKESNVEISIHDVEILDQIYSKEIQLNFYINNLVRNSAKKIITDSSPRSRFIKNMNSELQIYKKGDIYLIPELDQIPSQLDESRVSIRDGQLSISFDITISESLSEENFEIISSTYSYTKEFTASTL